MNLASIAPDSYFHHVHVATYLHARYSVVERGMQTNKHCHNHRNHTLEQWRLFILCQCHAMPCFALIKYELRSMIKGNGHYSVMKVYYPPDDDSDQYKVKSLNIASSEMPYE